MTDPLRVASYNVRYANLDEGWVDWPARRDAVAAVVRHHRPDAIALQECWMGQLADLRERLPGYEWVSGPAEREHTPIGYRPDRLRLEASGTYGISPDGVFGPPAWDAAAPRLATHATLTDRRTGVTFTFTSIHLDYRGEVARVEGARVVRERLPPGPTVVAGDCNCGPEAAPYGVFAEGLTDARAAATAVTGPAETYVGFEGDGTGETERPERKRLDYLFVRGFDVTSFATGTDRDDGGRHPSDHLPVVATLRAGR